MTDATGVAALARVLADRNRYVRLTGPEVALQDRGLVDPAAGLALTSQGERWFEELEIDIAELRSQRRAFVRECVDWTERRPHLAGSLGAALCDRFQELQWVRRPDRTRRLEVTAPGQRALHNLLGVEPADLVVIV